VSGDTVYQAYAPDHRQTDKLIRKVSESVRQASVLRENGFPELKRFVFLTPFDLTIDQHRELRRIASGARFSGESWGESRLLALLARHPEVKGEFPTLLLPDVIGEIRRLAAPEEDPAKALQVWAEYVPHTHPVSVFQKAEQTERGECHAYNFFRIHVQNDGLCRPSIEPPEEEAFLEAVRERFVEDGSASLSHPTAQRVLVEHKDPELRYHRAWGWWIDGTVAMAATLPDLNRPGSYSAAEIAVDVTRFLRLTALMGASGPMRIRLGYDPGFLRVHFSPSDRRADLRPSLKLRGVHSIGRDALKERSEERAMLSENQFDLTADAHVVTAQLLVPLVKDFHLARIDTAQFAESIPDLISGIRDLMLL
jgi:hypothetical protein